MNKFFLPVIIVASCGMFFTCGSAGSRDSVKFQQYYAQGENIYSARCSNCHQKSGRGLGLVYPPLDKSDFMDANFAQVICLIKYGKKGELIVNGNQFNQPMHGAPALTPLEVSELATYIYNTWEHHRGIVDFQEVSKTLEKCSDEKSSDSQ